jgi:hypothetical protein
MEVGQKVTVTNQFHAYCGQTGTITDTAVDELGTSFFVQLANGKNIMFETYDITPNKKGKQQ